MAWDWLKDGVGGGVDFLTGGFTDFDQKGNSINWGQTGSPVFGGDNKSWAPDKGFSFSDAMNAFTKGYAATMGPGGSTPGGSSFLNAYKQSSTPTTSSPVSTSSAFTAGGGTHTLGDSFLINEKPAFYAFKDNVQYPTQGSSGGKKSSALDTFSKGLGIVSTIAGLCDIRTKTDISPLETTEVNDDLAQVAFFVKELRECS